MYVRSAQRMRSPRRYVVTYALRRNLILVLPLRPSNSFSCSLSLARATKLPFDVKQPTRRLSLCPRSLFFLCLLFTAHTIIAFVPLRSSVVLNFHISAPRRKKRSGRKRRSAHLSIPRHGSNVVPLLVRKKDPRKKKGLRARMSSGVQLIEVHLCARPAARRSESAVRDNGGYGGVRGVYFHPSPSGSYSHRRTPDSARGGRGRWVGGRLGGRTLIKPS